MAHRYILENQIPIPCDDLITWAEFMDVEKNIRLALTEIKKVKVSTLFIGISATTQNGQPLLFETMVIGGKYDKLQKRYLTWDEAILGHKIICQEIEIIA